jgi:hypothetical protein
MKYKQFIAGFVTCAILLSAIFITGFAEGITVLPNPYPVTINGVEITVEAYNINGFTFLKLADVGKAIPNTTIKFNEIDKRIEINSAGSVNPTSEQTTSTEEVSLLSTATAIEYDTTTGLPVGAEIIEYKRWKNAVRYNDNIYLSNSTLAGAGIFVRADVKANTITIERNGSTTKIDIPTTPENIFLNRADRAYCNVNLFGL